MINPKDCFTFNTKSHKHQTWIGTWKVPPDLPYFEGHFPNNPILPGVGIIDGSLCAIEFAGYSLVDIKMKKAKFSMIIVPGIDIQIKMVKSDESFIVTWFGENEDNKFAVIEFLL